MPRPTSTALNSCGVYTGWKRTQSPLKLGTVLTASGFVNGSESKTTNNRNKRNGKNTDDVLLTLLFLVDAELLREALPRAIVYSLRG